MPKLVQNFILLNRQLSNKLEHFLPHTKPDITNLYSEVVGQYINTKKGQLIVDAGSGRETPFAALRNPKTGCQIVAVDLDKTELNYNRQADKTVVADINQQLPFSNNSVDLITSRYVFEHLKNPERFINESERVLKKGGFAIHLLSNRYALYAIINRLLPPAISQTLLRWFTPGGTQIHGFKAQYRLCTSGEIKKLFEKNNFKIKKLYLNYYQSRYFSFFLPLFIISNVFELILYYLKLKILSSYILIITRKS